VSAPWLVVVDVQHVFADSGSPWGSPMIDAALPHVRRLVAGFEGRTVATRFVAPEQPRGAWVPYYAEFGFALQPPTAPLYALLDGVVPADAPVVTRTSFGKWDDAADGLAALTAGADALVLAGVSTDCCVLSTALAAADAGVAVQVVTDACAGATRADHDRALAAMALYAPLITLTTADAVLAAR